MKILKKYCLIALLIALQPLFAQNKKYDFSKVDEIITDAISVRAFPSAVLVVGNSKGMIYQNTYGRLTYDEDEKTASFNTLYDLASVTKVIATTSAVMKLYDEGKIDLNATVASYIPEFAVNNKEDITVMNLLLHNSGLTAWTPFYQLYTTPQEVRNAIYTCLKEYTTGTQTIYSDYNAVLLGDIVEKISGLKLDKYCKENIFNPLGMTDTDFLIPTSEDYRIAPTENDTYWRNELLRGYVHDETAAMLEGVAGNAGLFSTGPELFKFMQMMMNKGKYIDERRMPAKGQYEIMFREETVDMFTTKVTGLGYNNTRAPGWETKPEPTKFPPACGYKFSHNCFGHTGYTGTSVWADKDKDIIVIFLTNRVYPTRTNDEIRNVRPKLHDEVCKILGY
ncbi:MAG: class A beta-lactamase-related serine hydrolase [Ignavibacteriae bacterium]|nr:MAG: class A beta-lactamase-related serine hydrolase [Ignavibacteriota bacterium]